MLRPSVPLVLALGLVLAGCQGAAPKKEATNEPAKKPPISQLGIKDVKEGTGPAAAKGDLVVVQYVGTLASGKEFDRNQGSDSAPFALTVGAGSVIAGWDQGLVGMKKGGTRELAIPYTMGYGEEGREPKIPPKSDLYFTVTLLDLVKASDVDTVDAEDVKKGTGPAAKNGDTVVFNYVGSYASGLVFEDTSKEGKPYSVVLGKEQIIPGIDAGLVGVKKGGRRKLHVPPAVGYLRSTNPNIKREQREQPVTFLIDVIDVKKGK